MLQPDTTVEVVARRVIDGPRVHFVLHFAHLEQIGCSSIEFRLTRSVSFPIWQRRREYWFRQSPS